MNYLYYKSKKGNFGDDLNVWLWPKIWGNLSEELKIYFLGIGSILYNENPNYKKLNDDKKIVFGSGIRPSPLYTKFKIDATWNIRFLRGPLSAQALENKYPYITDSAYALRQLPEFDKYLNCEKKYDISLMPYFHSEDYFDWPKICKQLGYHYISPHSENGVEFTIQEIAASRKIITEAMHGAIVADLLRVPWHRFILSTPFTEGPMVSEFKWNDWLGSVEINQPEVTYVPFYGKLKKQKSYSRTILYQKINRISSIFFSVEFLFKRNVRKNLMNKLSRITAYSLSEDRVIEVIDKKMAIEIEAFKNEFSKATSVLTNSK